MVVKQPFCLYELTLYKSNTKCAKTPLVELRKRQIATNIEMTTFLPSSSSTIKISGCEPEMEQTLKDAPNMQAKCTSNNGYTSYLNSCWSYYILFSACIYDYQQQRQSNTIS
ncbi:uncharacterized protein BX664DRAFT_356163 [Halteromyces radiatus]|uniref:uncharacterized protein n=1 Tax=Halteromyces radiatus TaxID=101107 RepID=UPI002220C598|nr:uncharacterized protein BX664DRAFT_356163 [Halteromyces radiatus]KAI8096848.1 hypothetical protein BX664DRAFT_356163 [Halteromyces radiatus]